MSELKFKQLVVGDWKQDEIKSFGLKSRGLHTVVIGSQSVFTLFKLTRLFGPEHVFPFEISTMAVPQDRPCAGLLKGVDLPKMYSKCNVLESQELSIEPMYMDEHNNDVLKASVIQIDFAPRSQDKETVLALLTSYGACQLWSKEDNNRSWSVQLNNLNTFFVKVFSMEASNTTDIRTLKQLKDLVDLHWITAFTWAEHDEPTIFLSNAAGHIVALRFTDSKFDNDALEYGKYQTNLGRITFLKSFDNFLLVGNVQGTLHLFTVTEHEGAFSFTETECLWSKSDRMAIQTAVVSFVEKQNTYYVLTTKAAHVLAYRLTKSGSISSNSTLYIGGVRISGLEMLSVDEFIVTTVTNAAHHLRLSGNGSDGQELKIDVQLIPTDVDTTNMQILGVSSSPLRSMWHLLLYRTKAYIRSSNFTNQSVFLSVSKLNKLDLLKPLYSSDLATFDAYLEHIVAIRIEIFTRQNVEYYNLFCNLENLTLPTEFSSNFLQILQVKYHIIQNTALYENSKLGCIKNETACEVDFVQHMLQIVHLICRLAHLQDTLFVSSAQQKPTALQKLSIKCMQITCHQLLNTMSNMNTPNSNFLHDSIQRFTTLAQTQLKRRCGKVPSYVECIEKCLCCDQQINVSTLQCADAHDWPRCCITYLQVPLFSKNHCASCNLYALDDDASLQQLLGPDEHVKCNYCRFAFVK